MRKIGKNFSFLIPVIAFAVVMVFMAGCEKKTEENKAIARRAFEEVWNQGKLDVIDEIFAAELCRPHSRQSRHSRPRGLQTIRHHEPHRLPRSQNYG